MDYRQLHAFVVLAQELHFGRAAQRLNVTQPALTQQIKNLENTLGLMLFVRDRRNVSLTTEGLFLIDEARVILGHCDKFLENVNSLRLGHKGQLKVGYVGSSILDPALTLLIKNYRHKKSETDLIIEEHNAHNLLTLLLDKRIDLAFVRSPIPQYEQLEYMNIATRSLIAVLPRNHELGNRRKISPALLAKEQFLCKRTLTAWVSAGRQLTPASRPGLPRRKFNIPVMYRWLLAWFQWEWVLLWCQKRRVRC